MTSSSVRSALPVSEGLNSTVLADRLWSEAEKWLLVSILGLEMVMGVVGNGLVLLVKVRVRLKLSSCLHRSLNSPLSSSVFYFQCRGQFCCRHWLIFLSLTLSDFGTTICGILYCDLLSCCFSPLFSLSVWHVISWRHSVLWRLLRPHHLRLSFGRADRRSEVTVVRGRQLAEVRLHQLLYREHRYCAAPYMVMRYKKAGFLGTGYCRTSETPNCVKWTLSLQKDEHQTPSLHCHTHDTLAPSCSRSVVLGTVHF